MSALFDLSGRLAVVTGASRGIGAAIARCLARDGFDIVLNYKSSREKAEAVADEVRAHFPTETLPVAIPRSVRISEAPSYGQSVLTYHPDSVGAVSYLKAAEEIARRGAEEAV